MKLRSRRSIVLNIAQCACFLAPFGSLGWGQDDQPKKEHPGGEAGSGGKTPERMGSGKGKGSPQKCDPDSTPKPKKKKAKKPDATKS